ncbi:MAG: hypothetical protein I4N51_08605 [Acinetobacter sp.]|nr:hypothetical protein [Acinetobacter sp.]
MKPNDLQQKQLARFREILDTGKQRYVDAGGNPRHYRAGIGEDYLTNEERQEASWLTRQMFGITVEDGYAHCQGRSWELLDNSSFLKRRIES